MIGEQDGKWVNGAGTKGRPGSSGKNRVNFSNWIFKGKGVTDWTENGMPRKGIKFCTSREFV
jgi:hypothetical protein